MIYLLCFPSAGGNSVMFRPWIELLKPDVQVIAPELAGRNQRLNDPPYKQLVEIAIDIFEKEKRLCISGSSFFLFGHSMGAIAAYEFIRLLETRGLRLPSGLIAAGQIPPHLIHTLRKLSSLTDDKLVPALVDMGGIPDLVINEKELLSFVLPVIRSDLILFDTYKYSPLKTKPGIPILVMNGINDEYSKSDLLAWQDYSTIPVTFLDYPGGHFFIDECRDMVIKDMRKFILSHSGKR